MSTAFQLFIPLILIHIIVAVGKLDASDVACTILHFKVGFEDLNVHELALSGAGAFSPSQIESKITIVSQNKSVHLEQHCGMPRQTLSSRTQPGEISVSTYDFAQVAGDDD